MMMRDAREAPRVAGPVLPALPRPRRHDLPRTVEELALCLNAAGGALMGLVVRGLRPAEIRSGMPAPVHDPNEAYGWEAITEDELPLPVPNAGQITDMDRALLRWVALIPLDPPARGSGMLHSPHGGAVLRRIVLKRSLVNPRTGRHVYSLRRIAKEERCSPESVRQWYALGLERILARLLTGSR